MVHDLLKRVGVAQQVGDASLKILGPQLKPTSEHFLDTRADDAQHPEMKNSPSARSRIVEAKSPDMTIPLEPDRRCRHAPEPTACSDFGTSCQQSRRKPPAP